MKTSHQNIIRRLSFVCLLLLSALAGAAEPLPLLWQGDAPGAADWAPQRAILRERWVQMLGGFPEAKVPLAPRWIGEPEVLVGYTRRKVAYTIEPGVEMDAVLLLPTGASRPVPGVVVFHPTLKEHYAQVAGYDESAPEKMMGPQLALRGYAVLCPRCYIFDEAGDYAAMVAKMQERHPKWRGMTRMVWDGMRALDYLASLPEVDAKRLGVTGHSLGAKEVLYVAALDERVKAAVFSEGGIGLRMSNWHDVWYLGKDIREPGFAGEHHELLALIAPRPFLMLAGGGKGGADNADSKRFLDAVLPLYRSLGANESAGFLLHNEGHRYPPVARGVAEAFLDKHLKTPGSGLEFIDTSFENASPVWYEVAEDGSILVHLLYDHERGSPNRAAGHFHFRIHAPAGSRLTLEFKNLDNIWNGKPGSVAKELRTAVVSEDGRTWKSVALRVTPDNRVRMPIEMPGPVLYVARVEPYRLSDLERLLGEVKGNPLVEVTPIGKTVEGRDLEVVRVGNADAPYRVFVRARAHPWEAGTSWVAQGLIQRLLRGDDEAKQFLAHYCLYVMPMANKDGVARGRTRFNLNGKDLNRNWDKPADVQLAPENAALERWLDGMILRGKAPHLALELHNDGAGMLHISRPPIPELERHLARMTTLEELLRKHTWFTEGSTKSTFRNAGTLGDGWLMRYGIDAAVHEFHCNWIAGLDAYPSAKHWQDYGSGLAKVFHEYFGAVKP